MDNSIFRKKSLNRISSPEKKDDYMKVMKPSIWLIVTAIILLVIAGVVWFITGEIETLV